MYAVHSGLVQDLLGGQGERLAGMQSVVPEGGEEERLQEVEMKLMTAPERGAQGRQHRN